MATGPRRGPPGAPSEPDPGTRLGVDTGGTFTDLVGVDPRTGALVLSKRPSRPDQPDQAVLEALDRGGVDASAVGSLILGTTIATNALLQRAGARVLYLTTAGFEDVLFIQRINRKFHYDLSWRKPEPLVARRDCLGVAERVDKDGAVLLALTEDELARLAALVAARLAEDASGRPSAVAVNLLFGYANPEHESRLAAFLRQRFPALPVSVSHEVAPIWREYERGSTVVADAYVKPLLSSFVGRLDRALRGRGLGAGWAIMKSNGSNSLPAAAVEQPVQLLLSGLAGGLVAGRHFGKLVGSDDVISLDMGGTSTDVGVVTGGEIGYTTEYQVEWGIPIAMPVVDLTTIGAGGGSIAWVDGGGLLRVGPQSSGAVPGPICYDQGGTAPTVTDANLVLGRLNPEYFLGGEIRLNAARARDGIAAFGRTIGMSPEETALALVELANENMANAIRLLTIERGIDPRDYDLVAFGGAGPLHAVELARATDIRRVVVPPHPGYGSALGALLADLRVDRMWTHAYRSDRVDVARVDARLTALVDSCLAELQAEGFRGQPIVQRSISMRYLGQNYEQAVPVPPGPLTDAVLAGVLERFHAQHERVYGYRIAGEVIELIHFGVSAIGPVEPVALTGPPEAGPPRPIARRPVYFRAHGRRRTPVYRRAVMGRGARVDGPAILEEPDATTVVPPGASALIHGSGALVIMVGGAEATPRGDRDR